MNPERFGRAVQTRRTALGLQVKQLAEATGISYPYMIGIEAGDRLPSFAVLTNLAQALSYRPWELLKMADEMPGLHPESERKQPGTDNKRHGYLPEVDGSKHKTMYGDPRYDPNAPHGNPHST